MEQQERERPTQKQASPRAGTPVGALMGVVPLPSTMGMINQTMSPGNPSHRQQERFTVWQQGIERLDYVFLLQFLHIFFKFIVCVITSFICENCMTLLACLYL